MTDSAECARVERALLCDYFGVPRPSDLADVEIEQPDPESPAAVYAPPNGFDEQLALANAVARIALSRVQSRLPRCLAIVCDEVVDTRKRYPPREAAVAHMPLHLCTINWADTGPGLSWPEAYHLTWFEDFQRFVVTASTDSTDVWGYEDRALGHFGRETEPLDGVRAIIVGDWRGQYEAWEQERWAELWETGAYSDPECWADEVWREHFDHEHDEF